ncbi:hypothetical protein MWU58_12480 [Flavobacteriaceae bacterium S0825]|uniref:hypothetical protein n=1 Tax=Gaetbulibacter sp. S0825 TaxID=2720084 RepID=UPI001FCBE959|nr:hypothetical protein [Gaetbulibacter sp. S0825]MCK0110115.1 hypothetical protein [Flavobacteriaceae bacterium S0825]
MILPKGITKQDKTDKLIILMKAVSDFLVCSTILNCSRRSDGFILKASDSTVRVCPLGSILLDSKRCIVLKDNFDFFANSNCV